MRTTRNRIDWSVKPLAESTNTKSLGYVADKAQALKSELVKKLSAEYADVASHLVFQSVNEAHALAATTYVPLLVLPALAEEKVRKAAAWTAHQRALLGAHEIAFAA